jgi:putative membrane protein
MKTYVHSFILGLIFCGLVFGLTACQRNTSNVEAAREPAASGAEPRDAEPNAAEPSSAGNAITGADREFVMQAEKINLQERVLGTMAQEKSQNKDVQDYGKMLVKDHNDALQKLVDLMNKNGMGQPKQLPEERSQAIKDMQGLSGAAFDTKFLEMMVEGHQKAIEMFRRAADSAQNTDVRDYAKDMLSTLEKHLKDAENLQGQMNTKR